MLVPDGDGKVLEEGCFLENLTVALSEQTLSME